MRFRADAHVHTLTGDETFTGSYILKGLRENGAVDPINLDVSAHLIGAWVTLLNDSPLDPVKPKVTVRKFFYGLCADITGTTRILSELGDSLLESLKLDSGGRVYMTFIPDFRLTPIFREYHSFYLTQDPGLLRYILSFCFLGKKAPMKVESFESTAFRKWLDVEERLNGRTLPEGLDNLKTMVDYLLQSWEFGEGCIPHHGPGSVADGDIRSADFVEKTKMMKVDPKLQVYLKYLKMKVGPELFDVLDDNTQECSENQLARLQFVPKNYKTARSICMEPAAYMYLQQGVLSAFERALSSGPLRSCVTLQDQGGNQRHAKIGSATGMVDTIDLSAASDSVGWDLVRRIFPTRVLVHLAGTRSSTVQTSIGPVKVHKFAPMGSALCFPTQCIVYAACTLIAYISRFRKRDSFDPSLLDFNWRRFIAPILSKRGGHFESFMVYGDDITCDFRVTSILTDLLTKLGFTVNTEKSFTADSAIRESCGRFYMNGYDVSFFKYSLSPRFAFEVPELTAQVLKGVVDMGNRTYRLGFRHLSEYFISSVRASKVRVGKALVQAPVYDELSNVPRSHPLFYEGYTGEQCRVRFNMDLQRTEVLSLNMQPSQSCKVDRCSDLSYKIESYMYSESVRTAQGISPEVGTGALELVCSTGLNIGIAEALLELPSMPSLSTIRAGARLKWGWTPAS